MHGKCSEPLHILEMLSNYVRPSMQDVPVKTTTPATTLWLALHDGADGADHSLSCC